jgi:hypothetical protein
MPSLAVRTKQGESNASISTGTSCLSSRVGAGISSPWDQLFPVYSEMLCFHLIGRRKSWDGWTVSARLYGCTAKQGGLLQCWRYTVYTFRRLPLETVIVKCSTYDRLLATILQLPVVHNAVPHGDEYPLQLRATTFQKQETPVGQSLLEHVFESCCGDFGPRDDQDIPHST